MCGFINYFGKLGDKSSKFDSALDVIDHRGPDDKAIVSTEGATMGFVRLSILNLSVSGRQPMEFFDGEGHRFILTFNGEIYNYKELASEVADQLQEGYGDTAVLGQLLLKNGLSKTLEKLEGMFAFCWLDENANVVYMARDQFGIKPFYYTKQDGSLLVASELKALIHFDPSLRKLSKIAVREYLQWGAVQTPNTIFEEITSLRPGHYAIYKDGEFESKSYYTPPRYDSKDQVKSFDAAVDLTRSAMTESVSRHLRSDVPVGVFLSGGLDSSIITSLVRKQTEGKVKAFSMQFSGDSGVPDESQIAKRTADHLGVDFTVESITADSLLGYIDEFITAIDQPSVDGFNTFLVSKVASRDVKVTLSGVGADEAFAGYTGYRYIKLAQLFKKQPMKLMSWMMKYSASKLSEEGKNRKLKRMVKYAAGTCGNSAEELYQNMRGFFSANELTATLVDKNLITETSINAFDLYHQDDELIRQYMSIESEAYLSNMILRDCDAVSMWHSLELRVPFVDVKMVDAAKQIPLKYMLKWGEGKKVLRDSFRDVLPSWIFEDKVKNTFSVPYMRWLKKADWRKKVDETIDAARNSELAEVLDFDWVDYIYKEYYETNSVMLRGDKRAERMWMVFVLCHWWVGLND